MPAGYAVTGIQGTYESYVNAITPHLHPARVDRTRSRTARWRAAVRAAFFAISDPSVIRASMRTVVTVLTLIVMALVSLELTAWAGPTTTARPRRSW
ncbi:MAG: hypothetical protein U1F43_23355 [Myxococcota bacterium]